MKVNPIQSRSAERNQSLEESTRIAQIRGLLVTNCQAWIDAHRKRGVTAMSIDASELHLTSTMDLLHQLEVSEAFALMVHLLTPQERAALLFSDVFGYAARETAQVLQSTEGAVKAGLRRARKKLKGHRASETHVNFERVTLNEDQNQLVRAYLAVFNSDDVNAVIQLVQADVLDAVQALAQRVVRENHHVYKMRWSGLDESTTTSLAA